MPLTTFHKANKMDLLRKITIVQSYNILRLRFWMTSYHIHVSFFMYISLPSDFLMEQLISPTIYSPNNIIPQSTDHNTGTPRVMNIEGL